MLPIDLGPIYRLGRVVMTPNARVRVSDQDLANALLRHLRKVWGQTDQGARYCRRARFDGCRMLSAYRASDGTRFWLLSESDQSRTTVMLPEDY